MKNLEKYLINLVLAIIFGIGLYFLIDSMNCTLAMVVESAPDSKRLWGTILVSVAYVGSLLYNLYLISTSSKKRRKRK